MPATTLAPHARRGNGAQPEQSPTGPLPLAPVRRLATPRVLVGALLVTAAGLLAALAAGGPDRPTAPDRVVTALEIRPGETITPHALTTVAVELPTDLAALTFADPADLVGAVALGPMSPGHLLHVDDVVVGAEARPTGTEVSLRLPPERALAGTVRPGETVTIMATYGSGADASTTLVAEGEIRLVTDDTGALGTGDVTVLLQVPGSADALRVVHAADAGQVTLLRGSGLQPPTGEAYAGPGAPG